MCAACLKKVKTGLKRWYDRQKSEGRCIRCGGEREVGSYCSRCHAAMSEHWERRNRQVVSAERIDKLKVFKRDGWLCHLCGRKTLRGKMGTTHDRAPELDHRVPVARGGSHTYENVQCACHRCNQEKGARSQAGQIPIWSRPAA